MRQCNSRLHYDKTSFIVDISQLGFLHCLATVETACQAPQIFPGIFPTFFTSICLHILKAVCVQAKRGRLQSQNGQ